ncbi:hypothetical protein ACSTLD_23615, partial [Vibrio parahaemolyticus]
RISCTTERAASYSFVASWEPIGAFVIRRRGDTGNGSKHFANGVDRGIGRCIHAARFDLLCAEQIWSIQRSRFSVCTPALVEYLVR